MSANERQQVRKSRNSCWRKEKYPVKQGLSSGIFFELSALSAKLQSPALLSAMNPALFFLLEQNNCLNIYPGSWTKCYSLGELWPSLERAWMCLHHSHRRDLTGFCWASLLICMEHEKTAPDLSHTSMCKLFGLFLKLAQARYKSLKNRWPPYFQIQFELKPKVSMLLMSITNHQHTFFLYFKTPHIFNSIDAGTSLLCLKYVVQNKLWSCLDCLLVLTTLRRRVSGTGLAGKWGNLNSLQTEMHTSQCEVLFIYYVNYQNN